MDKYKQLQRQALALTAHFEEELPSLRERFAAAYLPDTAAASLEGLHRALPSLLDAVVRLCDEEYDAWCAESTEARKRFRTPRVYALHGTALELADELARHPAVPLADARLNGDAAEAQLHVLRERHAQLALSTGAANRALLRQVDEAV